MVQIGGASGVPVPDNTVGYIIDLKRGLSSFRRLDLGALLCLKCESPTLNFVLVIITEYQSF